MFFNKVGVTLVLWWAVGCAFGSPAIASNPEINAKAGSRTLDQMIHPLTLNTKVTQGAVNTSLSVLGFAAFSLAFIVIPLLTLLFTSSSGLEKYPLARSINEGLTLSKAHSRHARGILDNDNCIERIVCEFQRGARNARADKWTGTFFNQIPSQGNFMQRVSKAYRAGVTDCANYTCEPFGFLTRLFVYVPDWSTILKG